MGKWLLVGLGLMVLATVVSAQIMEECRYKTGYDLENCYRLEYGSLAIDECGRSSETSCYVPIIQNYCNKLDGERAKGCFMGVLFERGSGAGPSPLCSYAREDLKPYCLEADNELNAESYGFIAFFVIAILILLPFIILTAVWETLVGLLGGLI
jgi:hypothetical protein